MKRQGKRHMTLEQRDAWTGRLFILPWIIGFLFLFAKPMIQTLIYSFQNIRFGSTGLIGEFIGFENYRYAFAGDPDFIRNMSTALVNLAYEVPIIAIYSLFIAMILNHKFRGRLVARAMFFLPVIIATGIVIQILKNTGMTTTMEEAEETVYLFQSNGFAHYLFEAGLNEKLVMMFSQFVNRIFDISWKSGIQILLYLAGLQTIPRSYYEASDIEGATAWESFWKITFPLISPISVVVIVYTVIDSFTYFENPVMKMIDQYKTMQVHYSATLTWIYFVIVFIIVGVVMGIISKRVQYMED